MGRFGSRIARLFGASHGHASIALVLAILLPQEASARPDEAMAHASNDRPQLGNIALLEDVELLVDHDPRQPKAAPDDVPKLIARDPEVLCGGSDAVKLECRQSDPSPLIPSGVSPVPSTQLGARGGLCPPLRWSSQTSGSRLLERLFQLLDPSFIRGVILTAVRPDQDVWRCPFPIADRVLNLIPSRPHDASGLADGEELFRFHARIVPRELGARKRKTRAASSFPSPLTENNFPVDDCKCEW